MFKSIFLVLLLATIGVNGQMSQISFEDRNPYLFSTGDVSQMDTIPSCVFTSYVSTSKNYYPRFYHGFFVVVESTDIEKDYIFEFKGDMNGVGNYIKIQPPEALKNLSYKINRFFLVSEDPGIESYEILFKIADVYYKYQYDLTTKDFTLLQN